MICADFDYSIRQCVTVPPDSKKSEGLRRYTAVRDICNTISVVLFEGTRSHRQSAFMVTAHGPGLSRRHVRKYPGMGWNLEVDGLGGSRLF